ncbi:TVP38/TMEM64 family protein [Falsiroseomonas sp.]|uniref:TVP38/TMEM64 family protein n=1 Tax=Falsiroseomonas sp. TaxID=2870721 RepID=UPI003F6E67F9
MSVTRLLRDRRVWVVLAVVAGLLALRWGGLLPDLSLDTLARHRAALTGLVAEHAVLAAAGFVLAYAAAVALSIPGAVILTLTGGFLFGALAGTALTVLGATLGATLVFLLARRIFGADALERLGPMAGRLAEGIRRNAASYLLVLRLVPLFPFFLVNLVPAFAGVRLPVFVLTTFVGIIPATAVFSLAGAGLGEVLEAGGSFDVGRVLTPQILGALLGLAALSLAAIPLKARFETKGT